MKIKELKKLIKDADDNGEVWIEVMDDRKYADCIASIDDDGTLVFFDEESIDEANELKSLLKKKG